MTPFSPLSVSIEGEGSNGAPGTHSDVRTASWEVALTPLLLFNEQAWSSPSLAGIAESSPDPRSDPCVVSDFPGAKGCSIRHQFLSAARQAVSC